VERISKYLNGDFFLLLLHANLAKNVEYGKRIITYGMVFILLYFDESIVELEPFHIVWTYLELLRISPCLCFVANICFSMCSNVKLKVTIFTLVFLIVDIMGGCQDEVL
jgi:hypothetical protein